MPSYTQRPDIIGMDTPSASPWPTSAPMYLDSPKLEALHPLGQAVSTMGTGGQQNQIVDQGVAPWGKTPDLSVPRGGHGGGGWSQMADIAGAMSAPEPPEHLSSGQFGDGGGGDDGPEPLSIGPGPRGLSSGGEMAALGTGGTAPRRFNAVETTATEAVRSAI